MIPSIIKKIAKSVIPQRYLFLLRRKRGFSEYQKTKSYREIRQGVERLYFQENAFLEVFWKTVSIGKGPSLSLIVLDDEVLRFDCFGHKEGHFHISLTTFYDTKKDRMFFFENSVEEQIQRTYFELTNNLDYYLQRNKSKKIRHFKIDKSLLETALKEACRKMREFHNLVPDLQ
ncbi:hypothetical protein SAMN04515674_105151 [Pseudarcicella hirudinis]|uniref:Uncharacterized protein n=1 Tax=Pseudarcicella hirudinis TaxID=1079859 RepID=A0A1I5SQN6_9BACT|nr:hypothetical protein [Pseudarcicella hirudinis]SFP72941.1 hypothetical protein SAMN04515674_105151 [Pseudarcicella hirudinis]